MGIATPADELRSSSVARGGVGWEGREGRAAVIAQQTQGSQAVLVVHVHSL